jgi:NADP-dependent 3-hydroxy acid dehydrogenase YdfG
VSAQVAIVAGAGGALGHATTVALAASGRTVVAVDRNERGLGELPDGVRREVADTTDPTVTTRPAWVRREGTHAVQGTRPEIQGRQP